MLTLPKSWNPARRFTAVVQVSFPSGFAKVRFLDQNDDEVKPHTQRDGVDQEAQRSKQDSLAKYDGDHAYVHWIATLAVNTVLNQAHGLAAN